MEALRREEEEREEEEREEGGFQEGGEAPPLYEDIHTTPPLPLPLPPPPLLSSSSPSPSPFPSSPDAVSLLQEVERERSLRRMIKKQVAFYFLFLLSFNLEL